ncbi:hypothetical protein HMN09_01146000 [Mycena chlorophos]|uniref:Uncharacterized protein n=1 Tax=Mycena chlorophos TaxID=658473 RepID=A0A8H6S8N5_MYCCL|nr:hypothetical protein HMN09_01146000 [Mycena chlorophos]
MKFRFPEVTQRDTTLALPEDAEQQAVEGARRDAIYAGLSAALVSAVIGSKFMRFNRTQMILSGVGSGVLSGYYFNKAFLGANLSQLERERERLRNEAQNPPLREEDGMKFE